ncbi:MAG TPA: transcription termination/antitermination NusG family protein [Pyrinomonadaceae bacterium]|jgi:transcriptional antiterminator RfaH
MDQGKQELRWHVIHTKPNQEARAESNLRAWNVEAFAPKVKESRFKLHTGERTHVIKPLFPGYIFAHFDADKMLHKIHFTRGVHCVVHFGEKATPVDDEVIRLIQSQVAEDGFIRLGEDFKRGDKVVIKDGPFTGLNGIFERRVKDMDRVMVLLTAVKYQSRILTESALIKKIA